MFVSLSLSGWNVSIEKLKKVLGIEFMIFFSENVY